MLWFHNTTTTPSPSSQLRSVWPAQLIIKVSSSEAPKNLGRKMSLSTQESVWGGRTQTWSGLFSWAAPQGTLWTPLLFWSPLSSAVLLCVLWREFLLQKEAWQYVTGAALISTRFISALFTPYKSWSQTLKPQLQCCDYGLSFLHGAGSNNCWSGSGMLLLPPAPTSFGSEIVFKWPTKTFTKYAKMKFSFPSDA